MLTMWILVNITLLLVTVGVYAGEQCTDPRAASGVRYCEYGCCVDSSSGQACCGFPMWIIVSGIVGGFVLLLVIIIAACCLSYKIQTKKVKKSVRPADRIVFVSSPVFNDAPARYSSAEMTSEYSYCTHELYEQPHFRQTFWTPDKNLHLYTSDTESYYGNTVLSPTEEIKSTGTNRSGIE